MTELATNLSPFWGSGYETLICNNLYILYQKFKRNEVNTKPGESKLWSMVTFDLLASKRALSYTLATFFHIKLKFPVLMSLKQILKLWNIP